MAGTSDLLFAIEDHSPEGIARALADGVSAVTPIDGKRPIDCLIEAYPRTARFADCVREMLAAGASVGDPLVEAVLLDDAKALQAQVARDPECIKRRVSLISAFTSCRGVTALHLCAEFNAVACATLLLEAGADADARAEVDGEGIGGQTPLFHAVNSIFNYCRPTMELLVEAGASLEIRVPMLLWGETMEWETIVFDSSPVSYAQCGLFRQFHREERHVYSNVAFLFERRHGSAPPARNVPNRYLLS